MLQKFVEVDHKCFRQFKWGSLDELSQFNLFYGWNATGKTTLSNLLADLGSKTPIEEGKVVFRIDNIDVQGDQIGQGGLPIPRIRVFNQQYVEKSVLSRFNNLEHIVFFGPKTVEHEQQRHTAAEEVGKLREAWKELSPQKVRAERAFDTYKQDQAQTIKTLLRTSGQDQYTNYNKSHFEARCEAFNTATDISLGDGDKAALVAAIRTDIRPTLATQDAVNPVSQSMPETITQILATSPTSVAIESLKDDIELAEWVGQGLQLHQHRGAKTCLFCENPLREDRTKQLEKHFDNSFRDLSQQLTDTIQSVQQLKNAVADFNSYPTTSVYPQLVDRLKILNTSLESSRDEALQTIHAVEVILKAKQDNIFSPVEPPPGLSELLAKGQALCESANEIQKLLAEHNSITNDFNGQVGQAKAKLESDFIASSIATYLEKQSVAKDAADELEKNELRTREVDENIKKLDEKLTETATPAEELNKDLALYLGNSELKLVNRGNGYSISRGEAEARDLCEGEKTALSLLYFLKSLEDHRSKLDDTIVVIDDPVSSLDASSMFTAFGFIKERTEKSKQLIVLTHDFSFFNLVKGWFHTAGKKNNLSRYYSLTCSMKDDRKCVTISAMDRLLKDFASEYQYLFSLVKKGSEAEGKEFAELYGLPNVGRRLLEHFIAFRFPGGRGKEELIEKMKKLGLDSKTLAVLNRFLNVHSHGDGIAAEEHDLNLLAESPKVMQVIMEVMRKEDPDHVERLEALIASMSVKLT